MKKETRLLCGLFVFIGTLSSCASPKHVADDYIAQGEWMRAVLEYRKAYSKDRNDIEIKSLLKTTEMKAVEFYYHQGNELMVEGNIEQAIFKFQQGLVAMPENSKVMQSLDMAVAIKEADNLYRDGLRSMEAGRTEEAYRLFSRVLKIYPGHKKATDLLLEIKKAKANQNDDDFFLTSGSPVTLNFRMSNLRTAFEFITRSFGINIIFDSSVKNIPITLFAKDVTFEQGLRLMLMTTKMFYKKISSNTIIVAPDNKDKRAQYEDKIIRTFQLSEIKAKNMAAILKGALNIKKIVVDEHLNMLMIRDTREAHELAEKLIEISDRKPAEVIVDVEILEVNRSKVEQLGLNFGSRITSIFPAHSIGDSSYKETFNKGTVTLPGITFNYFKQDVEAKTLANPKIRVVNGKSAKIHIGDRVPLRSATIQDATGQIRFSYDYKDIGIRLNVEPDVHLDNSVMVKLDLEVSTLGANLGTDDDPAYSIGTRNAATYMLLRDGETAILGGLIRDEERQNRVRVPGLSDIPLLGALFTSYDDASGRTDVVLTITPRVVRSWSLLSKNLREIYSGTETSFSNKSLFSYLEKKAKNITSPVIKLDNKDYSKNNNTVLLNGLYSKKSRTNNSKKSASIALPRLSFSKSLYESRVGKEVAIKLLSENMGDATDVSFNIVFNSKLLEFVRADSSLHDFQIDEEVAENSIEGKLKINFNFTKGNAPKEKSEIAIITMRGLKPGNSFWVYQTPSIKNTSGEQVNARVHASRVVVR